jgi:hypothetical protein
MEANREYDNLQSTGRAENRHEFPRISSLELGHRASVVQALRAAVVMLRLAETQLILYYGAK